MCKNRENASMPIYEIAEDKLKNLISTNFNAEGIREREDLQRMLRENISVIAPNTLIIAEEYSEWEDSRRRIDLLGIDRDASLVVIELKRTEDGGHMELQALRYAAMVAPMTFDQAVISFERYLKQINKDDATAKTQILEFLDWSEPNNDRFAQDVKIVLASADFLPELTTTVLWLNQHDLDIRCVRLKPYKLQDKLLIDVTQIIPLPEAAEYQVRVREKVIKERIERTGGADYTKYNLVLGDVLYPREHKGRAILQTFLYLVKSGIHPNDIAKHCSARDNRVLVSVDGYVGTKDFVRLANEDRLKNGKGSFDTKRFFCADEDLVASEGRTYAFSSQWGGNDWMEAMKKLQGAFPEKAIKFEPVN
jgi:hypothetical protein